MGDDLDLVTDQESTPIEVLVPAQAELLPIDVTIHCVDRALFASLVDFVPARRDLQCHVGEMSMQSQTPIDPWIPTVGDSNVGAREHRPREALDVEERR